MNFIYPKYRWSIFFNQTQKLGQTFYQKFLRKGKFILEKISNKKQATGSQAQARFLHELMQKDRKIEKRKIKTPVGK